MKKKLKELIKKVNHQSESRNIKNLAYDLMTPCSDCPFKKDANYHSGVLKSIPDLHGRMERGEFSHSCHKTDKRSDGYDRNHKGPVQHCAGAIILCEKDRIIGMQSPYATAFYKQKFKLTDLDMKANIFDSLLDMMRHYMKLSNIDKLKL